MESEAAWWNIMNSGVNNLKKPGVLFLLASTNSSKGGIASVVNLKPLSVREALSIFNEGSIVSNFSD